jgi:glycine betaine/proline transport system permease protein
MIWPRTLLRPGTLPSLRALLWPGLFVASLLLAMVSGQVPGWMMTPPDAILIDLAGATSAAMKWLVEDATFGLFTVKDATRAIASMVEVPYEAARILLVDGITEGRGRRATTIVPPISWIAVTAAMVMLGIYARNLKLGLLVGALFLYLVVFGQWESAMTTLASILIAVPLGVAGGLGLGIAAFLSPRFNRALSPVLDLMQTVPTFAYLVPILFLFGFGPVSALIATVIYAMPPMVRITNLALRQIPPELQEFARMVGCTPGQQMRKVLLPVALPDLMVGVNQVIMLSLNMVIIASMIGAGGLGFDVLNALRSLKIGEGIEAGLAITALAVALDRLSQALAQKSGGGLAVQGSWINRHPKTVLVLVLIVVTGLAGLVLPWIQTYPKAAMLSTSTFWSDLVRYVNVTYFDQIEAFKDAILLNVLLPTKRFLLALPWLWVLALVAMAAWQLGRARLVLLCLALGLFIAITGLWEQAVTTVYLCGISVLIAAMIGVPLGIWAAANQTAGKVIGAFIDTLQTLPSFVYLIPVIMLFRVGDFAAMIAVVLYALAPAVRYTAHGLRSVQSELVEAGIVCGCTRWQVLTRVRLPMALPDILLGVNQTIMLALSMLVITALVGTRDLGQEVYAALATANVGRGVMAGLAVAAIAIIADRLINAASARAKARLGLAGD